MDIVSRFGVKYSLLLITSIFPLLVSEFSFAMGGRSVPAGPDHPAPARHPGRCDRFADARGPLDSLRWQAAGQVVPLLHPLPGYLLEILRLALNAVDVISYVVIFHYTIIVRPEAIRFFLFVITPSGTTATPQHIYKAS